MTKVLDALRPFLQSLTVEGLSAIESSQLHLDECKNPIALYDTRKDELVSNCPSYAATVVAFGKFQSSCRLDG